MTSARPSPGRQRDEIVTLPSGSLRVRVYAGVDPLSGKRLYLTETVPAGSKALTEAKKVRTRLIGQIDEQRNPRTRATVNQLMDRYLDVVDVEATTRARYEGVIRLHVRPLLGELPVSRLSGETIDALHAVLRPCREHCDGRPFIVHAHVDGLDDAPTGATGTSAARCRRRASERSTSACPARCRARLDGAGSRSTRSTPPNRRVG